VVALTCNRFYFSPKFCLGDLWDFFLAPSLTTVKRGLATIPSRLMHSDSKASKYLLMDAAMYWSEINSIDYLRISRYVHAASSNAVRKQSPDTMSKSMLNFSCLKIKKEIVLNDCNIPPLMTAPVYALIKIYDKHSQANAIALK